MTLTRREFLIGSGVVAVTTSPLVKALLRAYPEATPILTAPPKAYGKVLEIWAEAVGDKVAKVSLRRPNAILLQSHVAPYSALIYTFQPGLGPISKGDITLEVENGKGVMLVRDANSYHYITGGVYWEDA